MDIKLVKVSLDLSGVPGVGNITFVAERHEATVRLYVDGDVSSGFGDGYWPVIEEARYDTHEIEAVYEGRYTTDAFLRDVVGLGGAFDAVVARAVELCGGPVDFSVEV